MPGGCSSLRLIDGRFENVAGELPPQRRLQAPQPRHQEKFRKGGPRSNAFVQEEQPRHVLQ